MLTGFKNAVEVDFTLEENKKKIEEAFKQAHAEAGAVYPLIIGGKQSQRKPKKQKWKILRLQNQNRMKSQYQDEINTLYESHFQKPV